MVSAGTMPDQHGTRRFIPEQMILPLVIASALFLENMDSTVLATSLPAIALDLARGEFEVDRILSVMGDGVE